MNNNKLLLDDLSVEQVTEKRIVVLKDAKSCVGWMMMEMNRYFIVHIRSCRDMLF